MSSAIPAQRYDFPPEDVDAVLTRLRHLLEGRRFLTLGDYGEEFEAAFAERHGVAHAVAVNSGTAAIEAILRCVGVEGGEVVVPTNTFAATAFAVIHAGARPVFADCDDSLQLDIDDAIACITAATKAVVIVHIGGFISPRIDELRNACDARGIALVEDAAHAHGSTWRGRSAGAFGLAGAFSFFSTKVMTTGEGGMVVTGDAGLAAGVRVIRDQAKLVGQNRHEVVGYNWRLSEMQAIIGLVQLARLDQFIDERSRVAAVYDRLLTGSDGLRPIVPIAGMDANYYKYIAFVGDEGQVQPIAERMAREFKIRMGGLVYDVPCHQQPVFAPYNRRHLPRAERLCRTHMCPPIYPSLTNDEAEYVGKALLEVTS